jgi:hypothetical protein
VVSAGLQMLGETGSNRAGITVIDQCVNQGVASAARYIGVGVAQRAQVARVVDQAQVRLGDDRASRLSAADAGRYGDVLLGRVRWRQLLPGFRQCLFHRGGVQEPPEQHRC